MKTTGMTSQLALLTLPPELIEAILVCSCSPRTVVAVAQTCQALRRLVYGSPGSHLWRELFLTTWDDPRPALEHRSLLDPRIDPTAWDWGTEYRRRVFADGWLRAWRRDVSLAASETLEDRPTNTIWRDTATLALSAVLNTLLTLKPFPVAPSIALTMRARTPSVSSYPTGNVGSGVGDRHEHMTSAPPLPPLLIALSVGFSVLQESRSGVRMGRMVYGPHTSRRMPEDYGRGQNEARELASIPMPSLPPQLVRTLFASHAVGVHGLSAHVPMLSWASDLGADPLGEVFHQILCITGFVPIPPPLVSTPTPTSISSSSSATATAAPESTQLAYIGAQVGNNPYNTRYRTATRGSGGQHAVDDLPKPGEHSTVSFPTPSQQHADARTLARRRVYDMQYLRGDRLWGPFQIVTRECLGAHPEASRSNVNRNHMSRGRGAGASASGAASRPSRARRLGAQTLSFDSASDDSEDEDWCDSPDAGAASSSKSRNHGRERTDSDKDTIIDMETEPKRPFMSIIPNLVVVASHDEPTTSVTPIGSRRRNRRSNPRLPRNSWVSPREIKPHHLRPDYMYLASVRIVVEANLRDLFGIEISDDIKESIPEARAGGVGMFWEDEVEMSRGPAGSSGPVPLSCTSSSSTTSPSDISAADPSSADLELSDVFARFRDFEVVRLGSACGYWGGWIKRQQSVMKGADGDTDVLALSSPGSTRARKSGIVAQGEQLEKPIEGTIASDSRRKGKEREGGSTIAPELGSGFGDWEFGPDGEACEGWDWAGVTGIWRRCVCWIDYRELLFFNLDFSKFLSLDVQEACRIIPMELRITGYTRAELMPVDDAELAHDNIHFNGRPKMNTRTGYFRPPPVIHFSGSSIGSDRDLHDGRIVKGSVCLIGGGEIRWQTDTYTQESTASGTSIPEWSSEAVQVGAIGSAIGLLGMWTGAGHERTDPLGPFWAWKVT